MNTGIILAILVMAILLTTCGWLIWGVVREDWINWMAFRAESNRQKDMWRRKGRWDYK